MKKNSMGFLVLIPALLLTLLGIGFLTYEVVLSLVNYKMRAGVFGSEVVGLANYERLFGSIAFVNVLPNGIWQTLLLIAISVPGAMLFSLLVGLIPVRPLKAAVAGGALILALLPSVMWSQMALGATRWLRDILYTGGFGEANDLWLNYWLNFIIAKVVPQTALCVFAGLAINLSGKTNGALGVLVAGLVPMLTVLMPDMQMNMLLGNSMNYESSDTAAYYVYRIGLQNAQFAMASAAGVFGKVVSLAVGVLPAVLISWISGRSCTLDRVREERYGWIFEALAALAAAVVLALGVMLVLCFGKDMDLHEDLAYNFLSTIVVMLIVMPVAFIYSLAMLFLSRRSDRSVVCVLGFAVLILAMSQLSIFTVTQYMLVREVGLVNTLVPVAVSVLGNPLFVTLLIVLMALRPVTVRQTIFLALGGAALAGACAVGEWFSSMIYVTSFDAMPLSMAVRQMYVQGVVSADVEGNAVSLAAYQNGAMALLVGMSLLVGIPGVVLTMAGAGGSRVQGEVK